MLEIVKMLLEIEASDISKDGIINHFINQALKSALVYCNVTELVPEHEDTIADLAVYFYKNKDSLGYKQQVQGERTGQTHLDILPIAVCEVFNRVIIFNEGEIGKRTNWEFMD